MGASGKSLEASLVYSNILFGGNVRTPVADVIEDWFLPGAADGFKAAANPADAIHHLYARGRSAAAQARAGQERIQPRNAARAAWSRPSAELVRRVGAPPTAIGVIVAHDWRKMAPISSCSIAFSSGNRRGRQCSIVSSTLVCRMPESITRRILPAGPTWLVDGAPTESTKSHRLRFPKPYALA